MPRDMADDSQPTTTPDAPPSAETVENAGEMKILDPKGESHTFKSIISAPGSTRCVLAVFIRHFYCGVSPILHRAPTDT
jgi:hypothetical protein